MKHTLIGFLLAALLISAGCAASTEQPAPAPAAEPENLETGKAVVTEKGVFTIKLLTNPTPAKAGEPTDLIFEIKNPAGEIVSQLQIVHEKPMHLLIVSEDLDEFYHEHPEAQSDGTFKTAFTFPHGGNYRLYTDFTPPETNQVVSNFELSVEGARRDQKPLAADQKFEKTVEDLRVVMKADGELLSGSELMLDFQVFDAQSGKPVTDLENYLGEKAHFVVISQDLQEFVHAHPHSTDNVKGAPQQHSHGENATPHDDKKSGKLAGPDAQSIVSAQLSFPKASLYKIWAQFKRGGRVITVPFTVDVKKGKDETPVDLSKVKIPEGYFKILVTKDGFTPNDVALKKGQPLRLAFYRADAQNCASEVVFKDLNITKKLPVGELVTVEIENQKSGEINFACGMEMYKGKIVLQ